MSKKWLFLILLSIIWGSSFILIKKGLEGLTPIQLGAIRTVLTGIIILAIGYKKIRLIKKHLWIWITISGLAGSFFPAFLFAIAETEIDSAIASILNSLVPLNTLLFGFILFHINATKRQTFGVVLGFLGTLLLIFESAEINPSQNYLYAGFIILATFMYALNVNVIKRYLQDVSPLTIVAGNYLVITIPAVIILCFSGFFKSSVIQSDTTQTALLYILILSIFGTALAKILFNKLIHLSSPVFASSVTYLMPIIALLWGYLDGEDFNLMQTIAALIILIGVYLSSRKSKSIS